MRILYDHQVFSWQTYGGISRYIVEQMRGLKNLGQEVFLPEHFFSENVYLRSLPEFNRKSLSTFSFKGKKWLQNVWGRQASVHAIEQIQPQVFHPTYFDPYFLKTLERHRIPFVLTVHDMIHEIYGHGSQRFFSLDARVVEHKRLLADKAAAVIAVSENTRTDLLRFCPELDPDKVKVIHHGNSLHCEKESKYATSPYLLFVGQRKAYKNFSWMVEQLADLLRSEQELALVCVGGSNFDPLERELFSRLGIANRIQYRIVRSDAELAEVYHGAACFIFPSQYEGFGIPVLEAFGCGCPVVLNSASSLPEVGGQAALYFDEQTPGSLETAVRRILSDADLRESLVMAGKIRAQEFTWQKSVAQHLLVYQSLVK